MPTDASPSFPHTVPEPYISCARGTKHQEQCSLALTAPPQQCHTPTASHPNGVTHQLPHSHGARLAVGQGVQNTAPMAAAAVETTATVMALQIKQTEPAASRWDISGHVCCPLFVLEVTFLFCKANPTAGWWSRAWAHLPGKYPWSRAHTGTRWQHNPPLSQQGGPGCTQLHASPACCSLLPPSSCRAISRQPWQRQGASLPCRAGELVLAHSLHTCRQASPAGLTLSCSPAAVPACPQPRTEAS